VCSYRKSENDFAHSKARDVSSPPTATPRNPSHPTGLVPIPAYLETTYWWAYLHPNAVRVFERQWLVNLILWGNFARLRNAALQALADADGRIQGQVLQVACVYGDFSAQLLKRLAPTAHLSVVDVAPIQISNLRRKLQESAQLSLHQQDSAALRFADASQDAVVLFFLLHEQPAEVRRQTLAEAWRVLKPGGRLVCVDYHRPVASHPLRWLMWPVLKWLEPFALDLWRADVAHWLPPQAQASTLHKQTCFGGLYQQLVLTR